jgi:glycosyltransferase involved in cell wall biosynthesis
MRVLQINVSANVGSTGKIAEEIGKSLIKSGHESYIAYGRKACNSASALIKIGNKLDHYLHGAYTLLTDKHGFASMAATKKLIKTIESIKPDLIALHNLHGYYINIAILFEYLEKAGKPVVWTFHDCWPFTGHCSHFENVHCFKWQTQCESCPKTHYYPKSYIDNSAFNFTYKKRLFTSIKDLTIVTPSIWLKNYTKQSFFSKNLVDTIPTGIDLNVFKPALLKTEKPYVLFVSNVWLHTKGYQDIFKLRELVDLTIDFIVVGISPKQLKSLSHGIKGYTRNNDINQLVNLYANAICLVNPTYSDNFPTVNIEALACGTPVVTYDTGGSPETIDAQTGCVVAKGDIGGLAKAVEKLSKFDKSEIKVNCRKRAEALYNKHDRSMDYVHLFERLVVN